MTTGYIFSTYFHTNSREDTQLPQFFPQDYQDYQPSSVPKYGDKMDRREDRVENEDILEDRDEQRLDNMYYKICITTYQGVWITDIMWFDYEE